MKVRKIYYYMDKSGFKYTATMFTNKRAAERWKKENEGVFGKELEICVGYAWSE